MAFLKKVFVLVTLAAVFFTGYSVGGQLGLDQVQESVAEAIVSSVDMEAAGEFLDTMAELDSIRKITEITTHILRKLLESICNFASTVL